MTNSPATHTTHKTKTFTKPRKRKQKYFEEPQMGEDLDVPGSELDDEREDIGSEDEENNFYSLGGDNHQKDEHGA